MYNQNIQSGMAANKPTFPIHNYNKTDAEIANLGASDLANVKDGWFIDKQFTTWSGANQNIKFDSNQFYKGHIKEYTMYKCTKNGVDFFYINLTCVVLTESGVYSFDYNLPVSFYQNSTLTKLLYELDIDVDSIQHFNFDDLKGKKVWASLLQAGPNDIIIRDMKNR